MKFGIVGKYAGIILSLMLLDRVLLGRSERSWCLSRSTDGHEQQRAGPLAGELLQQVPRSTFHGAVVSLASIILLDLRLRDCACCSNMLVKVHLRGNHVP
jgi:hypothetical protein